VLASTWIPATLEEHYVIEVERVVSMQISELTGGKIHYI
jgi:hypothetical protein